MSTDANLGGRPAQTVRWTIDLASKEFGHDFKTISKRVRESGAVPGDDGKFSTLAIFHALTGSNPRDDKDREQAINFRLRNEELQRTRIPLEIVTALWDAALQSFAATLKAAKGKPLTVEKINELLAKLRDVKLPVKW